MQTRQPHEKRKSARASDIVDTRVERKQETRGKRAEREGLDEDQSGVGSDQSDVDTNAKTPRLKFKVNMPQVPVQHPGHVLPARKYSSFREWLRHDEGRPGEDAKRVSEEDAKREARLRTRMTEATKPGGLLSEERCSLYLPEMQDEPDQQYGHQDHLIAQALHFRKLMNNERRHHLIAARKIAYAAAAEWKRRQPKTIEEKMEEQYEAYLACYNRVRKDLQAKWDVITAEVNRRRLVKWEDEQQLLGKQALNNMLEHSTQLLDARRVRRSSGISSTGVSQAGRPDGSDEESQAGSSEEEESNMSRSQSSSEDGLQKNKPDDDEGLTVEQLREKYSALSIPVSPAPSELPVAHIQSQRRDGTPASPLGLQSNENRLVTSGEDSQNTPVSIMTSSRERRHSKSEDVGDALDDESDESVDMDDDMGDSDEGQENNDSDASDAATDVGLGLLGFLGPDASLKRDMLGNATDREAIEDEPNVDGVTQQTQFEDAIQVASSLKVNPSVVESTEANTRAVDLDRSTVMEGIQRNGYPDQSSGDPSSQASPGTIATTKASEMDSASSIGLHGESQQPSSTTTPQPTYHLKTPIPSLLRGTLREYQHYGLDWLAGLYANGTNGILADEMGLGKTIQTIALLAHLACHHEVWGPHLIIVPTSVMLNWEMEFKKWCPGFKILTYYGTQEERKQKRKGWLDDDRWNVCIISYQLVLQDQQTFKRRNWHYMILDEAHNIKNFRSQRWQTLLTFKTRARLLLTGTPLQNNLTELWSLLFFLMPAESVTGGIGGFADLKEFSEWFRRPVEQILEHGRDTMDDEAKAIVSKLHKVLRPYLLRRLKADVEKQMPAKHEHVVYCRLSKRQRFLYDGFMSLAQTRETLKSGNYLSIINCLMQLRKVCNHPDLFETRPVVTSFAMPKAAIADYEIKELLVRKRLLQEDPTSSINIDFMNYTPVANELMSHIGAREGSRLVAIRQFQELCKRQFSQIHWRMPFDGRTMDSALAHLQNTARVSRLEQLRHCMYLTALRSQKRPVYGSGLVELLTIRSRIETLHQPPKRKVDLSDWFLNTPDAMRDMIVNLARRSSMMSTTIQKFACITPAVVSTDMVPLTLTPKGISFVQEAQSFYTEDAFHEARIRLSIAFPDRRLLQYDCGKLQRLDKLLRDLQAGGHRALIFTQMTRVLDILEQFLNIHGHRYLRLDGATKVEQRQILTERFNNDPRILAFILSSRSGGLGINLTGADTVIFYDLDWNPAMDKQCQDRCHRIGQTRDVHIYRFVSEYTIESNILRKANQKQMLDDVVIQEGDFTTDYFNKISVGDMLGDDASVLDGDAVANAAMDRVLGGPAGSSNVEKVLEQVEDQEDTAAAKMAEKEIVQADDADFDEKSIAGSAASRTPVVRTPKEQMPPPATPVIASAGVELSHVSAPPAPAINHEENSLDVVKETDVTNVVMRDAEEPGHIDEYMIRFMEWELSTAPIMVPLDKSKNKGRRVSRGKGHA